MGALAGPAGPRPGEPGLSYGSLRPAGGGRGGVGGAVPGNEGFAGQRLDGQGRGVETAKCVLFTRLRNLCRGYSMPAPENGTRRAVERESDGPDR